MTSVKFYVRTITLGLLLLGSMLAATPVLASIIAITVSPGSVNAPLGGSISVAVTWGVTTNTGTFVSSPNGTFNTAGGVVLGTVSNPLFQSVTVLPGFGSTVSFTEVVLIPTDVIYRAYKMGLGSFLYSRSFTDSTGAPSTQSATINITSSAVTGFSLTGMSLMFDNGAVVRLLGRKEKLSAQADINFTGNGLLQGVWEVADPASTAGQPVFRPLISVRQYLVGSDKQTLRSPILPTNSSGLYLVR
ncbi:MAG: hypothetical protein ACM3NI_08120, partial [Bacteroidota bacterium]